MKVLLKTEWNTGRLYSPNGQEIRAWLVELDAYLTVAYFADRGRGINGMIEVHSPHLFTCSAQLKEHAMYMYDRYQYSGLVTSPGGEKKTYTTYNLTELLGDDAKL